MVAGLMTMVELLQKTGLATTVDETPNLTVFVPSNAAFKADAVALGKLDADGVANVLKAHGRPPLRFHARGVGLTVNAQWYRGWSATAPRCRTVTPSRPWRVEPSRSPSRMGTCSPTASR